MRSFLSFSIIALLILPVLGMLGCKEKDPSVLKVFVRNENNELQAAVKVVIIGDQNSNPATPDYVDTVLTNSSGFAYFDMAAFFDKLPKKESTGYFDIIARKVPREGTGYIRCRAHITNVETVFIKL